MNAEIRRARNAAYYAKNRERILAKKAAERAADPEASRASARSWHAANRERSIAKSAAWRAANPDRMRAACAAWRQANPDKYRSALRAWAAANPETVRAMHGARRARKRSAAGRHTAGDIRRLAVEQGGRCAAPFCRKPFLLDGYHIDHVVPLAKGGGNGPDNLQLLCPGCNQRKGAKPPARFLAEALL